MKLTAEQEEIILAISQRKNVKVTAVAGSGKTSTILGLIGLPLNILVFCYNNKLRNETIERLSRMLDDREPFGLFDIHTFHSYCHTELREPLATTDIGIIKIVRNPGKYLEKVKDYDVIIVDEVQDMTPEYQGLISILRSHTNSTLCLLGDPRQAIYQFNGASEKFLEDPEKYFGIPFVSKTLSESFRLTRSMASFVNGMYSGQENVVPIVSKKENDFKPLIIQESASGHVEKIVDFVSKFNPGDIMILVYSVKRKPGRLPVRLANALSSSGIPVSFGNMSNESDKSVLILSYHQSKGLERKVVILLDLGAFYFDMTHEDHKKVPNLWYVAMTRASEFFVAYIDSSFPFITAGLKEIGQKNINKNEYEASGFSYEKPQTFEDYVRYTPSSVLWERINAGPEGPIKDDDTEKKETDLFLVNDMVLSDMIEAYIRIICIGRKVTTADFISSYKKTYLGGLNYDLSDRNIGHLQYAGYSPMTLQESLELGLRIFTGLIKKYGETSEIFNIVKSDIGSPELFLGNTMIVIVTTFDTIKSRLRWSAARPGDLLIILKDQTYYKFPQDIQQT